MYRYKEKPLPENVDLQALVLTEQISRDYVEVLRTVIVPDIHSEHGLKLREIRVLMCLASSPAQYISASEVADHLRQDKATIARSAIILIGAKLVRSTPNLDDSRVKNLYLTDEGRQVAQSCTDLFETRLEEIQELDEMEDFILQGEYTLASLKALENRGRLILQLAKRTQKTTS